MPLPTSGPFRFARTCYRHPAGQVGVAITDWLLELAWVLPTGGGYRVTSSGLISLMAVGVPVNRLWTGRPYPFCTDTTEKRHHLSGDLGAALTQWLFFREWASRPPEGGRLLLLTEAGRVALTSMMVKLPMEG